MANQFYSSPSQEIEEKAGYNQAGEITKILAMLRLTFTSSMIENPNNFDQALESCRSVLNIISGKVNEDKINELNEEIYKIEDELPNANKTFVNDGMRFYQEPKTRLEIKRKIENLWRKIERVQDEHGYGMFSEDDSGL